MKVSPVKYVVALLSFSVWSYSTVGFGSDSATQQAEQVPVPAAGMNQTIIIENPEAFGEGAEEENVTEYAMPAPAVSVDPETETTQTEATQETTTTPISGAFGIPLGESFQPRMVAKIIGQEDKKYKEKGKDKTEFTGTLYKVEPKVPNKSFNEYSLLTNKHGIIYSITGKQVPKEKASACQQTKQIADFLKSKYGRPRGRGIHGEWYAFRESTTGLYKGLRFYAPRCRNGKYSIVYSDDGAMMQEEAPKVGPEDEVITQEQAPIVEPKDAAVTQGVAPKAEPKDEAVTQEVAPKVEPKDEAITQQVAPKVEPEEMAGL